MQHFHEISPLDITDNFIRAIGQEWMLITAGDCLLYTSDAADD